MQKNYISLTVSAILVIIFGFMLFTFQVRQTQVAIKTQFGDVVMVGENKAGIKPGDIVTRFDGKNIGSFQDLARLVREKKPGDEVEMAVIRENQTLKLKIKLEKYEGDN